MEKTSKGGLSRLISWLWRSEDTDNHNEVTNLHSRPRRPPLVTSATHNGVPHAERPYIDPMHNEHGAARKERSHGKSVPVEHPHPEAVQVEHSDAKHVPTEHTGHKATVHNEHGHGSPAAAAEHGHLEHAHDDHHGHDNDHHGHHGHHGHHDVLVGKGTGGRLELHGNTLHLTKGGLFGFFVTLLGLHGGHAHQTIRVSDISAIEFEKHGFLFHYVRFCYPGAPKESGNHLHDMMADNALLMSIFDNRGLYRIKERIEQSMENKTA